MSQPQWGNQPPQQNQGFPQGGPPQQQGWGGQPQQAPQQQGWGGQPQQAPQIPAGPVDDSAEYFKGSGPGIPGFDFGGDTGRVGAVVQGVVVEAVKRQQTDINDNSPMFWGDDRKPTKVNTGQPVMQLVVTLQTALRNWQEVNKIPSDELGNQLGQEHDDGKRKVYIRYKMQDAVSRALHEAGHKGGLMGGMLGIAFAGMEGRAKLYNARFVPAGQHQGTPPAAQAPQVQQQSPPPAFAQQTQVPQETAAQQPSALTQQAQQGQQAPQQGGDAWGGYQAPPTPQSPPQPPASNPWGGNGNAGPPAF